MNKTRKVKRAKSPDVFGELLPYNSFPLGGTYLETNAEKNKTGTWRVIRPVLDKAKCVVCYICWILCPDGAIEEMPDETLGINYEYCKGCGLCANECPVRAITMEPEEVE